MKNQLKKLKLTILEKIAFIEFCEDRENDVNSHLDTYRHLDGTLESNIRFAISQETIEDRLIRKQEDRDYYYDNIRYICRMTDAYADECTLNGK